MNDLIQAESPLAAYLRDRRMKLDPAAFGFPTGRRRTPGLRREEVAARANISSTWYTWLEQGRGGAPSADVLDRISRALMLTDMEREHLFLMGLGRPPEARYLGNESVTRRLQRVLDALDPVPALIRTVRWDVVGWNQASKVMLMDYSTMPPEERNILRYIFLDPRARAAQPNWEAVARYALGTFRLESARAGASGAVQPMIEELSRLSPAFKAMWDDNELPRAHGEAVKHIHHPVIGPLAFEYSSFAVDGRTDLNMVVYNPATPAEAEKIAALIKKPGKPRR